MLDYFFLYLQQSYKRNPGLQLSRTKAYSSLLFILAAMQGILMSRITSSVKLSFVSGKS